jgi:hypothetical protein
MIIVSLGLISTISHSARSENPKSKVSQNGPPPASLPPHTASNDLVCRIYSLNDLGSDPQLGVWVSKTLPNVVQPGSWREVAGEGTLSYYPPGNIMVIYHSAAVQAQVAAFLRDVKTALPKQPARAVHSAKAPSLNPYSLPNGQTIGASSYAHAQAVTPAKYSPPSLLKVSEPAPSQKFSYPVPEAKHQPKHLFHFIIRYEGEGVIDASVVKLFKALYGDEPGKAPAGPLPPPAPAVAPVCPAPAYAPSVSNNAPFVAPSVAAPSVSGTLNGTPPSATPSVATPGVATPGVGSNPVAAPAASAKK